MRFSFTLCLAVLALSSLSAQDYFAPNSRDALIFSQIGRIGDARGLGMGNAHSAISDNYTATVMNPATLGLSRRITINTSVGANLFRNDATFLNNKTFSSKTETFLNQFGFVLPLASDTAENNVVLSIGYNQSNNYNNILKFSGYNPNSNNLISDLTSFNSPLVKKMLLSYPLYDPQTQKYLGETTILNSNLQEDGYALKEGTLNLWSIGFAYEFAHNVFFGLSANYIIGSYISDREYSETDSLDYYTSDVETVPGNTLTAGFEGLYIKNIIDRVYNGVDFRFGVLYKFYDFISIGASVKTPSIVSVDDSTFFNGQSKFSTGNVVNVDSALTHSFTIQSPYEITVAAAVNIFFLTGTAEVTYIDYTQMRFTDGLDIPARAEINKLIIDEYSAIFNMKAGAEFRLPFTGLSARAGAMYLPSPLKGDPMDFDKKFLTAGLGIKSGEGAMEFNVAYVLGFWNEISSDYGPNIPQITRKVRSDNIIGSLVLRF